MADEAIGLTPLFPVTAEVGIVEMPDFARITHFPALPRFTGVWVPTASICARRKAKAKPLEAN